MNNIISRRAMLQGSAAGLAALACGALTGSALAEEKRHVYKIGTWSSNFEQAQKLGLDALQVSFSLRPRDNGDLRNPDVQKEYLERSEKTGVAITSFAMGEFNGNPLWQIDDAEEQVTSCINAMAAMNVKQVLISFFGKADLNTDEKYAETIKRFKALAPKAEDKGVILAVEAPLNAEQHLRIIDGVNSPAVQIYYDPGNMIRLFGTTEGICEDIRKLKGHIVEAHCKDRGILGKGRIDYAQVLAAYREIGFFGTQVIEGSIDGKLGYEESIRQDAAYMRSI